MTVPPAPVPGAVVAVAHAGAGSGEVQVDWNAVRHATGYRILRSDPGGDRARIVADFDITTGRTTAAAEVVTILSAEHNYVPGQGSLTHLDRSPWFEYIDYLAGERCYRVQAYSTAGNGPLSAVTCASPMGAEPRPARQQVGPCRGGTTGGIPGGLRTVAAAT